MKAYLGIKYHANHSNKAKVECITTALNDCGYAVICITRDLEQWGTLAFTPQELMQRTFDIIRESDVVVIDLSEKGVGLGIEAGYAYAQDKPIIALADNEDISTTLLGISSYHYTYTNENDLLAFLKSSLPAITTEE